MAGEAIDSGIWPGDLAETGAALTKASCSSPRLRMYCVENWTLFVDDTVTVLAVLVQVTYLVQVVVG